MLSWIAIFTNPGTAFNYVGSIKWACKIKHLDTKWYADEIPMHMKGKHISQCFC